MNHVRGKARRGGYGAVYVADYDDSYAESPYDDLELSTNGSDDADDEEEDYARFVDPRNAVARFRRERTRYDYSEDPEPSFARGIRVPERESASPRWFSRHDEKNIREMRGSNLQSDERRKRTKILSRAKGGFEAGT